MKEGQGGVSALLDKELGVTRESFCSCGAKVAKAMLSSDGYQAQCVAAK